MDFYLTIFYFFSIFIASSNSAPPVLGEVSPSFTIKKEGEVVDLFCEAYATPEPSIAWYKDGRMLLQNDKISISNTRVQISKLDKSDGGTYRCVFKNMVGQVKHDMKLVIEGHGWISAGNAYIMAPPKNTTTNEGSRVKLTCHAAGYPNNITYRWYKNSLDIQKISGLMTRAAVYTDGSFVINKILKEDTGWYKCVPTNGLGIPPEARAYLNVTYLPMVLNMPFRIYLPRGMEGYIDCPVESNPPATMILWTKDDIQLNFEGQKRLRVTKEGTLVMSPVEPTDSGVYACTPYSALGAGKTSSSVTVYIRAPPYFTMRPKSYYQRQLIQSVTLPCAARGDPPPSILWRKAKGKFPPENRIIREAGNLTIMNLIKDDHGLYECVATNIVTVVITTTLLIIESTTPHAPYNIETETTSDSAKVSWLPAYDGGYKQHYILWFRKQVVGQDEWNTMRIIPEDATSMTLYNLTPNTQYQFCVLSRNRLGDGLFSKIVSARTKKGDKGMDMPTDLPPQDYSGPKTEVSKKNKDKSNRNKGKLAKKVAFLPDPVTNITCRQENKGILITWNKPNNSKVPIDFYDIDYRTVGPWVPLTATLKDNKYLWTTSSRGAKYQFKVISVSIIGSRCSPAPTVTFYSTDPLDDPFEIPSGVVGGITGGLIFLVVTLLLSCITVKICAKRRQKQMENRYGNVKYSGPQLVEADKITIVDSNHTGENECDTQPSVDYWTHVNRNHTSSSNNVLMPPVDYWTDGGADNEIADDAL